MHRTKVEGEFTLSSKKNKPATLRITDPCYEKEHGVIFPALPGRWVAFITMAEGRVETLTAHHEIIKDEDVRCWTCEGRVVGVDSGQAGFFDDARYDDIPTTRYEEICRLTDDLAGCFNEGVVSSSGFGDGLYVLKTMRDGAGLVIAAEITFIEDEEEIEDDEEEEDGDDEFTEE